VRRLWGYGHCWVIGGDDIHDMYPVGRPNNNMELYKNWSSSLTYDTKGKVCRECRQQQGKRLFNAAKIQYEITLVFLKPRNKVLRYVSIVLLLGSAITCSTAFMPTSNKLLFSKCLIIWLGPPHLIIFFLPGNSLTDYSFTTHPSTHL
jgi:hypothetical protein